MDKSTKFIGQPIFLQLIKLIPRHIIRKIECKHATNRYIKCFDGYNHLVTLLFSLFARCDSLREISSGMLSQANRLSHLGIKYIARRSTLSDANKRRNSAFFADIYYALVAQHSDFLSDSRTRKQRKLHIIDSTTITLFKEILKGSGQPPKNGKRKGGIKVHTLIDSESCIPSLVVMGAASENDVDFFADIKRRSLPKGSFLVFDKGYISYADYEYFSQQGISYVTKRISRANFKLIEERTGSVDEPLIVCDQIIEVTKKADKKKGTPKIKHRARCVVYKQNEQSEELIFQTNNFKIPAMEIVEIYRRRWQIETLFKQLKQNFELKYFLGDNANAIECQIWAVLIANMLVSIIKRLIKRKSSFTGVVSLLRLHIMDYISMFELLENPEQAWIIWNERHNKGDELLLFSP